MSNPPTTSCREVSVRNTSSNCLRRWTTRSTIHTPRCASKLVSTISSKIFAHPHGAPHPHSSRPHKTHQIAPLTQTDHPAAFGQHQRREADPRGRQGHHYPQQPRSIRPAPTPRPGKAVLGRLRGLRQSPSLPYIQGPTYYLHREARA